MTEQSRFKTLSNSITQVGESKININTVLASAMQPLGPGCLYFSAAWLEPVAEKAQLYHEWNSATKISRVKITDQQDLARECLHVLALLFVLLLNLDGVIGRSERGIQGAHVAQVFPEFSFPLHPAIPPSTVVFDNGLKGVQLLIMLFSLMWDGPLRDTPLDRSLWVLSRSLNWRGKTLLQHESHLPGEAQIPSLRGKAALYVCSLLLPVGKCVYSVASVAVSGTCSFQIAAWIEGLCLSRIPPVSSTRVRLVRHGASQVERLLLLSLQQEDSLSHVRQSNKTPL